MTVYSRSIQPTGGSGSGSIANFGDVDAYTFNLVAGYSYEFMVEGQGSGAGTLAYPTEFLTFGGLPLSGSAAGPSQIAERPITPNVTGTYTLDVGGTGAGSYTLVTAAADDYNSLPSAATPLAVGSGVAGGLQTGGDVDTFAVTLVAGYTYQFDAYGQGSGLGTALAPGIAVENAGLGDVANSTLTSPGDGRVSYTPSLSGTYLLAVNGAAIGSYALVSAPAVHTTNFLTPGSSQAGTLTAAMPTNVFQVTMVAGASYTFNVLGADTGAGTALSPALVLSAPDGSTAAASNGVLTEPDGPLDAGNAFITYTAPTTGTYALTVRAASPGSYDLLAQPASTISATNLGAASIARMARYIETLAPGGPQIYTGTQLALPTAGSVLQAPIAAVGGFAYTTNGGSGAIWTEPQVTGVAPSIPGDGVTLNGPGSYVVSGNKADTIVAATGNNFIATGTASAATILLQNSINYVASEGRDTITASAGVDTIEVSGAATIKSDARITVISDSGAPIVGGGYGSATVYGGFGGGQFTGGMAGNNLLVAGTSATTLTGGGSGDLLLASGGSGTVLNAATGNETLSGQYSSGANTFSMVAGVLAIGGSGASAFGVGSGSESIVGGSGANTINLFNGPRTLFVANFHPATDVVNLNSVITYQDLPLFNDPSVALAGARTVAGSEVVSFSDGTTIAFLNVTGLTAASFHATTYAPIGY